MALEGTVKTPLGDVSKKTMAIAGVGGAAILGIVWYRSKKQAAADAAAASTTTTTDPSQNIDPATGFPYGSVEDSTALQQQQAVGGGFGPVYGGGGFGGFGGGTTGPPGPGTFTSNAQWAQYAEQYLVDTLGLSSADVGNALGKYITAQPVDDTMVSIINQARAFAGAAPVPGSNGNPPGFIHVPSGPPPPPPGDGATNPVTGLRQTASHLGPRDATVQIAWDASPHATSYRVTSTKGNVALMGATSAQIHSIPNNRGQFGKGAQATVTVLAEPAATNAKPATLIVNT